MIKLSEVVEPKSAKRIGLEKTAKKYEMSDEDLAKKSDKELAKFNKNTYARLRYERIKKPSGQSSESSGGTGPSSGEPSQSGSSSSEPLPSSDSGEAPKEQLPSSSESSSSSLPSSPSTSPTRKKRGRKPKLPKEVEDKTPTELDSLFEAKAHPNPINKVKRKPFKFPKLPSVNPVVIIGIIGVVAVSIIALFMFTKNNKKDDTPSKEPEPFGGAFGGDFDVGKMGY